MSVVVFDPAEFREIHPQFADFTDARLRHAFEVACLVVENSECSAIPYDPPKTTARETILRLLVCHLAELSVRGAVGVMTHAAQGSVSAGFDAPNDPGAYWFNQTQCGATARRLLSGFAPGGRLYLG